VPQSRLDVEPALQRPPCVDHHILVQVGRLKCKFLFLTCFSISNCVFNSHDCSSASKVVSFLFPAIVPSAPELTCCLHLATTALSWNWPAGPLL
jgi:hypothetical protein